MTQQFGNGSNGVSIDNVVSIFRRAQRAAECYVRSVLYGWVTPLLECGQMNLFGSCLFHNRPDVEGEKGVGV